METTISPVVRNTNFPLWKASNFRFKMIMGLPSCRQRLVSPLHWEEERGQDGNQPELARSGLAKSERDFFY